MPTDFVAGAEDALLRLSAATLIGAAVGLNRELRGKPAGMRTHALVSLGAALVILSTTLLANGGGGVDPNAVSRSIQGIVAGVGFLGGGVILKTSDRSSVRNLMTAASIWVVACLGIVCGAGQWSLAAAALALTLLVLVFGGPTEGAIRHMVLRQQRAGGSGGVGGTDASAERRRMERRRTGEHRTIDPEEDA
ncbi:MgtC/SapB transporter [Gemmatirosa kalamazoonensis]|uniref:MgtC/SapB transporter n=1 Tax=Gemmatirosa kalamazoonensis TaxID=861299 RepID=W0RJ85_9BACT|nr:MgtC/SapB family protein [Gemmatirosa kalamazoonensis]AHG90492.1 MgtC/SapB transporter [Gemmatirosa kalamazoonensis]